MFKSSFFKNIAFLSAAAFIGKIASVIALPILSRLYTPEAFGLYSVYFALLMALPLIGSMRLDFAMTISKETNTARLLAAGAFISLSLLCLITTILLSIAIYADILPFYLWVVPFICLSVFLAGGCDILRYWGVRNDQHKIYGKAQLTQSISLVIAQLALFYLGVSMSGLVIGDTVSRVFMFSVLFFAFKNQIFHNIKWHRFIRIIKKYIARFATYTLTQFLHAAPHIVMPIFIASMYSKEENGHYMMGFQILFSISGVFISALTQVFLGNMAKLQKSPASLKRNLNKVVGVLSLLGLPCAALLMLWGPAIYEIIFGEQWTKAGQLARILAPAIYIQLVLTPVLGVFIVLKKPLSQLYIDLLWVTLMCICLIGSWHYGLSLEQTMMAFSGVTFLSFSMFYIQITTLLNRAQDKIPAHDAPSK